MGEIPANQEKGGGRKEQIQDGGTEAGSTIQTGGYMELTQGRTESKNTLHWVPTRDGDSYLSPSGDKYKACYPSWPA